jgi:hypothetical protein
MFTLFGILAVVIGQDYTIGSAGKMGPGYFPTALGSLLTVLGLIAIVRSFLKAGEGFDKFAIKPGLLVLLGVFLFGFLIRGAGMIAAVFALVMVSAYASSQFHFKSTVLLAIGGTVFCAVVFVLGLGVPMPLLGSWFGN